VVDLDLEVCSGERLLVVGRSGIGKSSLMRSIAGLWTRGGGSVTRPPPGDTLFLSQKPYMTMGSLRENVLYPNAERSVADQDILDVLAKVNLANVAQRLGGLDSGNQPLQTILSLGEQQRLAFARLLLAKPSLVILDESTSALGLGDEKLMYTLMQELGITVISVGNRPSLLPFHSKVLRLKGDGAWALETPEQASENAE
jgi:putative ATP-binding cassette transporter